MAISKGANTYLSTRNLERSNVALPGLALGDLGTNLIHDAAELVTQDVVLVHLDHAAVQEMEIRAADGAACDLEDDILGLDDFGPGHVRWKKVSTLGSFLVSRKKKEKEKKSRFYSPISTLFFPIQTNAFMVRLGSPVSV